MAGVSAAAAPDDHAGRMSTRPPDTALSLYDTSLADLDLAGRPPRVVLDTGVVVSALVFGGAEATRLRRAWRHGFCRPLVCRRTLMDLTHQLSAAQLGFSLAERQQMLSEYLPYVLKVRLSEVPGPGDLEPAGLAFVQLGLAGQAHALVTSDASMLAMGAQLPFQVMALEPFLELLRQSAIAPMPLRQSLRRR